MTKIEKQLENGLVCDILECGECNFSMLVPHPLKHTVDCGCGNLLDVQDIIKVKSDETKPPKKTKQAKYK